jgi:hypothetical protein
VPSFYILTASLISNYANSLALKRLLPWPITWPVSLYLYLFDIHVKSGFEAEVAPVNTLLIVGNFLLYASLAYLALWALSKKEPRRLYR